MQKIRLGKVTEDPLFNLTVKDFIKNLEVYIQGPDGISKVKKSIITLAISGRLVPHSESNAGDLYKEIVIEKEKLIKEKKIKKLKKLPEIDNNEQFYEIPKNWKWVRLGNISTYAMAPKMEPKDAKSNTWVLELEDVEKETSKLIKKVRFEDRQFKSTKSVFKNGDIVYGKLRPYLDKVLITDEEGVCTTEMIPFNCFSDISHDYIRLVMKSPQFISYANDSTHGMNLPRLGTDNARMALIPLPALEEQQRIVTKVEELMVLCDQLEAQQQQQANTLLKANNAAIQALLSSDASQGSRKDRNSSATNSTNSKDGKTTAMDGGSTENAGAIFSANWQRIADNFHTLYGNTLPMPPGEGRKKKHLVGLENLKHLRQAILQLAVTGKLVPQKSIEVPASELIASIQNKKQKMIKQKNIGKQSVFPIISDDDKPFQEPNGWSFVRLGQITNRIGSGSTPRGGKSAYVESGIPFLRSQNIWNEGLNLDDVAYITDEIHEKMSNTKVLPKDILLNITGASLGRSALISDDFNEANVSQHVTIIRPTEPETRKYLHLCILSPHTQNMVWGRQVG